MSIPNREAGLLDKLLVGAAREFNLEKALVMAIIKTESSGLPSAARYEPNWRWFVDPEIWAQKIGATVYTEKILQATSIGVMQVMGAVARELGHKGWLSELFYPRIGLHYGCKKLRELVDKYETTEEVVSAYNQGTPQRDALGEKFKNQAYVDKVMGTYRHLKKLFDQ